MADKVTVTPHVVSIARQEHVSNEAFLKAIFGDQWRRAHVASFPDDPGNIPTDARRRGCWAGGAAGHHLPHFTTGENHYFCISLFHLDDKGKARRRGTLFDACCVIVADDVGEKLDQAAVDRLPAPSYRLQTSAGSEQRGWILDTPCHNQDHVGNLLDGLVAKGLAPSGIDPGMKGVTRYVRLPEGSNTKASRQVDGQPFKCQLLSWHPERRYSIKTLADVFDIDLEVERFHGEGLGLRVSDPIVANHPIMGYLTVTGTGNDNWIRVDCPNAAEHSSDDASGAAVQIQPDGRVHFQCHHGHCNGESEDNPKLTGSRLLKLLDQQQHNGSDELSQKVRNYCRTLHANQYFTAERPPLEPVLVAESGGMLKFDPWRYIYLPSENKFYDLVSGTSMQPCGLDNLYRHELPGGRNQNTASQLLLERSDKTLTAADGLGWKPVGIHAPTRKAVIFHDGGRRLINTWRGFAVSPIEGDVSIWLDHFAYLIPDERERNVVLDYLAHRAQHPGDKPSFAILHRGTHRTGKDLGYRGVVLAMGTDIAHEVDIDTMLSWGDYVSQAVLLLVSEVDKAQDKRVANRLKTFVAPVASGRRTLNLKGGLITREVDAFGTVLMTNKRAALAIEQGDRRYFVADSWVPRMPPTHYRRLNQWYLNEQGPAKILRYLLHRDISRFDPATLPYVTPGMEEMTASGRYDYEMDLEEAINTQEPPFHYRAVTVKELKAFRREQGLRCGNNGLEDAMRALGWLKFRGIKTIDGKSRATPTFYTSELEDGAPWVECYDYYQRVRGKEVDDDAPSVGTP